MRLRRGLVFWGLFLIPLGAIPLLARAGIIPDVLIADAWRLWPLLLIGLGLLLVLGRTRASLAATALVALIIGSVAGAAFAAGPPWGGTIGDCGLLGSSPPQQLDRTGTFDGPASIRLDLRCGTLDLHPAATATWQLDATYRGAAPVVAASGRSLSVTAPDGTRRQEWTIAVPAGAIDRIDLTANAGTSKVRLDGIQLGSLGATVNAGDVGVAVGSGGLDRLDATINAGQLRLDAGSTNVNGSVTVNAGNFALCVPATASLRLTVTEQLTFGHNLAARGLARSGGNLWTREGSGPAVTMRVEGNAAALTLDPEGGCK